MLTKTEDVIKADNILVRSLAERSLWGHVKVTGQVGRAEDDRGRSMLSSSTFDISQLEMNIVLALEALESML